MTENNSLKFSAQESKLALFVGNKTKVKTPFEIKLPLESKVNLIFSILTLVSETEFEAA